MVDQAQSESLTVEELAARAGMTVRTVRFYAGRKMIRPPRRDGRHAYYGPDHLARLELVRELQAHGFTLSAIEGYLRRIPADATTAQIALHRTLLAPWTPELPETVNRAQLTERAGRELDDDDLELLTCLGIVESSSADDVFQVAPAYLGVGIGLLELGLPLEAAQRARRVFTEHGRQIADELAEIFHTSLWPRIRESNHTEEATTIIERLKPLTVNALITAYEQAVDETKRATIRQFR